MQGAEENFDVLSFFTPPNHHIVPSDEESVVNLNTEDPVETSFLHILDLPQLSSRPPYDVLKLVLQLLRMNEVLNFGAVVDLRDKSPKEIVAEKDVSENDIQQALPWLQTNCQQLDNMEKLTKLCLQRNILTENGHLISYLTTIVSSPLSWITSESEREDIWKMASTRISENSGRAAFPEFTRKIIIDTLPVIWIKEPSLSNDNIGLKTWGSSLMLSTRLTKPGVASELLAEPILELGAGTGLIGITCGLLGYQNVLLTDLPPIVPNLRENVRLNGVDLECTVLDWSSPSSFIEQHSSSVFNTIILSDPIYSEKHAYWIRDMLELLLPKISISRVLLQVPLRYRFESMRDCLWQLLQELGLEEVETKIEQGFDDFGEQEFVFKVMKWKRMTSE